MYLSTGLWVPAITAGCAGLLFYLSVSDIRTNVLPNIVILPAIMPSVIVYHWGPMGTSYSLGTNMAMSLAGGILAAILGYAAYIASHRRIGAGDVKLLGLIGTMAGLQHIAWAMIAGTITTGVVALVLLTTNHRSVNDTMPMGPFLCISAVGVLIFGPNIAPFHEFLRALY